MGLIHPNGILAGSSIGSPKFRLASAMGLKKKGVRYIGGKFEGEDIIKCVRIGERVPVKENDGILIVNTQGMATDIEDSLEFHNLVDDITGGLISPLVDCTPYLKGVYKEPGESSRDYAQLRVSNPQAEQRRNKRISVFLVNESKLSPEELVQLYCRRFAFCDTNVFKSMYA